VRQQDVGDVELGKPFDEPNITNVLLCIVPLLGGASVFKMHHCVQELSTAAYALVCFAYSPVAAEGAVGGKRAVLFGLPGKGLVHWCVGLAL
jgi:hypothetical protein